MNNNGSNGDKGDGIGGLFRVSRQPNIASELIGQDRTFRKYFLTLSNFVSIEEANLYSRALHRCDVYHLEEKRQYFLMMIHSRVSVKGYRSGQVVDVLTQIQKMEQQERDLTKNDYKNKTKRVGENV